MVWYRLFYLRQAYHSLCTICSTCEDNGAATMPTRPRGALNRLYSSQRSM